MKAKRDRTTDKPKCGMVEASEEVQKYFDSYPNPVRLMLDQVLERSREKSTELASK